MQVEKLKIIPKACMQPFEVNHRSTLAMREVEKEHKATYLLFLVITTFQNL